jgi:hypothetical protein
MAIDDELIARFGGRTGGRIAALIAAVTVHTRQKLGPHNKQVIMSALGDLFALMDSEAQAALGPWLLRLARSPDAPAELRPLLSAIAKPTGQWQMFAAGSVTGAVMSGGLGSLISNDMAPLIYPLIRATPNLAISPTDAAALRARGIDWGHDPAREAASSGIDHDRFEALVELNTARPAVEMVLTLLNRGAISPGHAEILLRRNGFNDNDRGPILSLRHVLIPPERLADLVNFGVMKEDEAAPVAAHSGVSTEDFHRLVLGAGQPPAIREVLLAWRRGIIDDDGVERALRQSPIRFEWLPVIKSLQWEPLPLSEAADAVNQGHLTLAQAQQAARENGVKPEDFRVIVDNAGIPPGPQTVLDWTNRGLITESEALQALYESRIKNKWVPKYLESRYETMPPETVRLMVSRGAMSKEDGLRRLQMRGYSPEDAAIIMVGAVREKSANARDLTVAQVLDLYELRAISREEAAQAVVDLGYDPDETEALLEIRDLRRMRTFQTAALGRVHAAYVARRITEDQAVTTMDSLRVAPAQRQDLLDLWDIERSTYSRSLTPAEIISAAKKSVITVAQGREMLIGAGYPPDVAEIKLAIAGLVESVQHGQ